MFHPDHQNNIYELQNLDSKTEIVKENKDRKEASLKKIEEDHRKMVEGETYQLSWENRKSYWEFDKCVNFNEKHYVYEDIFTRQGSVKSEFNKLFKEKTNNFESLKKLTKENHSLAELNFDLQDSDESMIDLNYSLYQHSCLGLGMSYKRLFIAVNWTKTKRGDWKYNLEQLRIDKNGCYFYMRGSEEIKLQGFYKNGISLIKEKLKHD
ncbi:MAG: hypothetical protein AABY22_05775, partial [Nanoarchaeota archaeon]